MAEQTLLATVGAPPAPNFTEDVLVVQTLLTQVDPPLKTKVAVTGKIDDATVAAIREFQKRFMSNTDGWVDPNGRTLMHLNDGFTVKYVGCSPLQRMKIDRMLIDAQRWLDVVNRRLGMPNDPDVRRKVLNVFHIRVESPQPHGVDVPAPPQLLGLRAAFDRPFGLKCVGAGGFKMYVIENDPAETMHFPPGAFTGDYDYCLETVVHERSHSVFKISHDGMEVGSTISIDFDQAPDDDNGLTFQQAIRNAYCYGWLARAPAAVRAPDRGILRFRGMRISSSFDSEASGEREHPCHSRAV